MTPSSSHARARARARGYADAGARGHGRGRGGMRTRGRTGAGAGVCGRSAFADTYQCAAARCGRAAAERESGVLRRHPAAGSGGHRTERIKRAEGICGPQTSSGAYNTRRQGADRHRRAGRVTAPKKTRVRTQAVRKGAGAGTGAGTRRGVLSGGAGAGCAEVSTGAGAPGYKYSRISVMFSQ